MKQTNDDVLLPEVRRQRIRDLLSQRTGIRVSTLSQILGVSEVTIRRDLVALEGLGLLERSYGGALTAERAGVEPRFSTSTTEHQREKEAIARLAVQSIATGDTVFFNHGTTTLEVFRLLQMDIRVVTSNLGIVAEAVSRDLEVFLVGGQLRTRSNSVVGSFAAENLRRIYASKSVLGVDALNVRDGLTIASGPDADVTRLMLERTRGAVIVVADHTKIGKVADFPVADIEEVTALVVDEGIAEDYLDELKDAGVNVLVARITSNGGLS